MSLSDSGLKNSSAKMVSKGDILYALYGATSGEVGISKIDGAINQAILAIKLNNLHSSLFIFNWLAKSKEKIVRKFLQGGQGNLSSSIIKNLNVKIPDNISEQNKVGRLIGVIDEIIELHQRKINTLETQKKAYLNVLFPKINEFTPSLRVNKFKDEWEQHKLKTVIERVQGNDGRMYLPTLTISARNGWMDQRERFSGNIAGKEQKNYTLLSKNELSYNKGNSKLAKYGVVFKLEDFEEALVPRVYHSFKATSESDPDFIEYVFATKKPDRELAKLITSGARMDGLLNINFNDFVGIKITIPDRKEQIIISNFIKVIDNIINLHLRKLFILKKMKQVYLNKMFI